MSVTKAERIAAREAKQTEKEQKRADEKAARAAGAEPKRDEPIGGYRVMADETGFTSKFLLGDDMAGDTYRFVTWNDQARPVEYSSAGRSPAAAWFKPDMTAFFGYRGSYGGEGKIAWSVMAGPYVNASALRGNQDPDGVLPGVELSDFNRLSVVRAGVEARFNAIEMLTLRGTTPVGAYAALRVGGIALASKNDEVDLGGMVPFNFGRDNWHSPVDAQVKLGGFFGPLDVGLTIDTGLGNIWRQNNIPDSISLGEGYPKNQAYEVLSGDGAYTPGSVDRVGNRLGVTLSVDLFEIARMAQRKRMQSKELQDEAMAAGVAIEAQRERLKKTVARFPSDDAAHKISDPFHEKWMSFSELARPLIVGADDSGNGGTVIPGIVQGKAAELVEDLPHASFMGEGSVKGIFAELKGYKARVASTAKEAEEALKTLEEERAE